MAVISCSSHGLLFFCCWILNILSMWQLWKSDFPVSACYRLLSFACLVTFFFFFCLVTFLNNFCKVCSQALPLNSVFLYLTGQLLFWQSYLKYLKPIKGMKKNFFRGKKKYLPSFHKLDLCQGTPWTLSRLLTTLPSLHFLLAQGLKTSMTWKPRFFSGLFWICVSL